MKYLLRTAHQIARNPDRRLCLGVSLAEYLSDSNPLRSPIAIDHHGYWQGIVSDAYQAKFLRQPLRLELADRSPFAIASVT